MEKIQKWPWQFDIINGKNVDQYNKSLNNLHKVLQIDDFVRNQAIPYFVTEREVFEINKLPLTINPTDNNTWITKFKKMAQ